MKQRNEIMKRLLIIILFTFILFAQNKKSITYVGEVLNLSTQHSDKGPVTHIETSRGKFFVEGNLITVKYDKAYIYQRNNKLLLCLDSSRCCKVIIGGMW